MSKLTFEELLERSSLGSPEAKRVRAQAPADIVERVLEVSDAFHEHLDMCRQCSDHPFDLCSVGQSITHSFHGVS